MSLGEECRYMSRDSLSTRSNDCQYRNYIYQCNSQRGSTLPVSHQDDSSWAQGMGAMHRSSHGF